MELWKNIIYVRADAREFPQSRAFARRKVALTIKSRSRSATAKMACMAKRTNKRKKRAASRRVVENFLGESADRMVIYLNEALEPKEKKNCTRGR